jgi:hypothetical protein
MSSLKYESFQSRQYEIIVNGVYGYHFIRERFTGMTTLLFVCSEGYEEYRMLKAAWRKSRRIFDSLCSEYSYD